MRPALYYPWVYLKGGAERTLLELMSRSRHDWTLYTNRYEPEATFPEFQRMPIRLLREVSVRRSLLDVACAGATLLTQKIDTTPHDAMVVVSEGLGNLTALRTTVPTSCVCLTPLKIVYDQATRSQYFQNGRHLPQRFATTLYARLERPAWRRYARVFCNSRETMRRVLDANLVSPDRVEVAYHGVDCDRFLPGGARDAYFLVPGRIMWTKNVELALEAWTLFKPRPADNAFRLVIAGMVDRKSEPYLGHLRALAADRPDVSFVPNPGDDELVHLYQRSHAVVHPALNEDLGLVPLEAMACGKPVLATDRGGPRETVVDGHTGLLLPDTAPAFAGAMRAMEAMSDCALDRMGVQARGRAAQFSWDTFTHRIDEHIDEIGARPRVRT